MSAQKQKKANQINLLPQDKFASSTVGRILAWLLSTFRIIVISVEMIVMLAFLSRFWLDSKNSDLNDEIGQKQAQIQASQEIEKEFRKIQARLSIFSTLTSNQKDYTSIIKTINSQTPPEIVLTSIDFIAGETKLTGKAPDERSLAQYMVNLQSSKDIGKVSLTQLGVDKDNSSLLTFSLGISEVSGQDTKKGGGS